MVRHPVFCNMVPCWMLFRIILFIATPNIRRLQRLPKISQWTNSTHLAYNFGFLLMLKPSICQVALLEDIILDKLVSLLRSGTESYIIWRISCTL